MALGAIRVVAFCIPALTMLAFLCADGMISWREACTAIRRAYANAAIGPRPFAF
jgi:hypothetical protein